mmetsp:Transcript_17445/g.57132  ORF Transcript_17445/g.57132 Transcript_17445/m.57132 type:complete len:111 (+) Transcript_17445:916-1248(+)
MVGSADAACSDDPQNYAHLVEQEESNLVFEAEAEAVEARDTRVQRGELSPREEVAARVAGRLQEGAPALSTWMAGESAPSPRAALERIAGEGGTAAPRETSMAASAASHP